MVRLITAWSWGHGAAAASHLLGDLDSVIHNVCCYQIQQFLMHVKRATPEIISIPL